jgi:hypothetical protein
LRQTFLVELQHVLINQVPGWNQCINHCFAVFADIDLKDPIADELDDLAISQVASGSGSIVGDVLYSIATGEEEGRSRQRILAFAAKR